ncbi:MAG: hypothetical protein ACREBO_14245 [Novosphingobium sp.]
MSRRTAMQQFARWHIWLGWAVGVPVLLWLASGLLMTLRPIEEVRGEHLRRAAPPVVAEGLTFPTFTGTVSKVALMDQAGRATWVVTDPTGQPRRYDARSGSALGPVAVNEARVLASSAFAGDASLIALRRFSADAAPLDLRRARPSWLASFADGTRLYLDADSGEVLAVRTRWWRIYDFAWGLHIMDLQTREDTSHPWLWTFGGIALVSGLFGTVLLFRRRKSAR